MRHSGATAFLGHCPSSLPISPNTTSPSLKSSLEISWIKCAARHKTRKIFVYSMADSCLGCCGGLSLMVVLQMLFVRDFFSETICVRKHRGILCIPWQKELGSFPSASLSKEFEGGEREREECYQYLVKVRTHLDLSCKKGFSGHVLAWSVCLKFNKAEKKNLPSFLEKYRANFRWSVQKWWIMSRNICFYAEQLFWMVFTAKFKRAVLVRLICKSPDQCKEKGSLGCDGCRAR